MGFVVYFFGDKLVFDKKSGQKLSSSKTDQAIQKTHPVIKKENIPEHLTGRFWKDVTLYQLNEKLKDIGNVNEVRRDNKQSMLHLLVLHGRYPEMVSLLVSAGVNYNLMDRMKFKALHYAVIAKKGSYEWTKEILRHDKNIDAMGGSLEGSPLMWALLFRSPIQVIKLLLEKGANPNLHNKSGATPLMAASFPNEEMKVSFIDPQVIRLLLNYKVDITVKNKEGKTAWDYMKANVDFTNTDLFKKLAAQHQ